MSSQPRTIFDERGATDRQLLLELLRLQRATLRRLEALEAVVETPTGSGPPPPTGGTD